MALLERIESKVKRVVRERQYLAMLDGALARARAAGPDAALSPRDLFANAPDDCWFWLLTEGRRQRPSALDLLPGMPPPEVQERFTGKHGDATLAEAFNAFQLFREIAERAGTNLADCGDILDFGCGWGRIIRFFQRDVDGARLWGADCLDEAVGICRATNRWCRFEKIAPEPPTPFPDGQFGLIYSFSVFSHLAEEIHLRWIEEFARILRPGGIVIATTRRRDFIQLCAEARRQPELRAGWLGAASAFEDTEAALADYDAGRFCFSAVGGGGGLENSFYGESCIPEAYARRNWSRHLEFLEFADDPARCSQSILAARKPL